MRRSGPLPRFLSHILLVGAAISLSACTLGTPAATPTRVVDAIYTAAFQTLTVQRLTQQAVTPPTPAATATLFPTLPPPATLPSVPFATSTTSSSSGTGGSCNNSVFVNDVTIPDGTVLPPSKNFVKTWTLMNNGTCAWDTSYKLAFISGDSLGGTSVPMPLNVPVGQQAQISVSLTAPDTPGDYKGSWQLVNPQGQAFGNVVTIVIKVAPAATDTPTATVPAATGTPTPTSTPSPTPT